MSDTEAAVAAFADRLALSRKAPNTIHSYTAVVRRWLDSGLTPQEWIDSQVRAGRKGTTVNQQRAALMAYHHYLGEELEIERLPEQAVEIVPLTLAETMALLEACQVVGMTRDPRGGQWALGHGAPETYRKRLTAMVAVQVTSGLRVEELCRSLLANLRPNRRLAVVGKGSKEREVRYGLAAAPLLEEWLEERERLAIPGPYIFCSLHGTAVLPRAYTRQLADAGRIAGIERRVYPHLLRHSFATAMVENSVPVTKVAHFLGHSSATTTMRYVHHVNKRQDWTEAPEVIPVDS